MFVAFSQILKKVFLSFLVFFVSAKFPGSKQKYEGTLLKKRFKVKLISLEAVKRKKESFGKLTRLIW